MAGSIVGAPVYPISSNDETNDETERAIAPSLGEEESGG